MFPRLLKWVLTLHFFIQIRVLSSEQFKSLILKRLIYFFQHKSYFLLGVVSFAIAHICYFTAFGIKPFNFRLALALLACFLPVCAVYIPFISSYLLKCVVPLYMILLFVMLWRAVSRLQIFNKNIEWTWTKMCCSLGALFFVISDSILSFDLFIYDVPYR